MRVNQPKTANRATNRNVPLGLQVAFGFDLRSNAIHGHNVWRFRAIWMSLVLPRAAGNPRKGTFEIRLENQGPL
jgi:hypothetical protein